MIIVVQDRHLGYLYDSTQQRFVKKPGSALHQAGSGWVTQAEGGAGNVGQAGAGGEMNMEQAGALLSIFCAWMMAGWEF